jgi:hypothetical protein
MIEHLVHFYLCIGIVFILLNKNLSNLYMTLLVFFFAKMVFNYRKCTISYIECKLRNVKKEKGYLYRFMGSIVDLRDTHESVLYYIFASIIMYYYYIDKNLM